MLATMYIDFLQRLYKQRLLMHFFFWLAVILFCFFVFRHGRPIGRTLQINLGFLPGHMFFVYSLNYFLFPRYVLKGRLFAALAGFAIMLAIALIYMRFADVYITHNSGATSMLGRYNYPRVIYALFSIGWIGVTIRLVKHAYIEQERKHRLEKEKLTVELRLLRSQLHPHFLFNTLNSLYAMTLEQSKQAPEAVLRLSALLRYILYECSPPIVPLEREIEMVKYYIELEQMRFGERLDCSLSFTGDLANRSIAPLLFLPFVENCIKHGISEQLDKSWVSLYLHVEENTLSFKLINSYAPGATTDPSSSGLGLLNVRRRLDLVYPENYTLFLLPEEDTYLVHLTIRLPDVVKPGLLSFSTPVDHEAQMSVG